MGTIGANFKINVDARNAGNGISRLQISKISLGSMPPDPLQDVAYGHIGAKMLRSD